MEGSLPDQLVALIFGASASPTVMGGTIGWFGVVLMVLGGLSCCLLPYCTGGQAKLLHGAKRLPTNEEDVSSSLVKSYKYRQITQQCTSLQGRLFARRAISISSRFFHVFSRT
jgi:hypothetical protein